ncbi:MAG: hypothetical protein V1766_06950 [Pseudomonadota bacterium]
MNEKLQPVLFDLMNRFIEYIPKLLAGLALLGVGWFLAWLMKRLIIHISVVLKLEHFLNRSRWKRALEKADVRHGFYNFVGNIFFVVIFLIFLDYTLITWGLTFFSDILGKAILLLPRLMAAFVTFGIGWLIARLAANALQKVMISENVRDASFVASYARVMLIVLFSAMSLINLDIAGEIVLIGFSTIFITLGLIAVITVAFRRSLLSEKKGIVGSEKDEEEGA